MIRFEDVLSPELLELLPPSLKPGVDVDVDTGTTAEVVSTCSKVRLPLTVRIVVTTCWVLLMTDLDGVGVVLPEAVVPLVIDGPSPETLVLFELSDSGAELALFVF